VGVTTLLYAGLSGYYWETPQLFSSFMVKITQSNIDVGDENPTAQACRAYAGALRYVKFCCGLQVLSFFLVCMLLVVAAPAIFFLPVLLALPMPFVGSAIEGDLGDIDSFSNGPIYTPKCTVNPFQDKTVDFGLLTHGYRAFGVKWRSCGPRDSYIGVRDVGPYYVFNMPTVDGKHCALSGIMFWRNKLHLHTQATLDGIRSYFGKSYYFKHYPKHQGVLYSWLALRFPVYSISWVRCILGVLCNHSLPGWLNGVEEDMPTGFYVYKGHAFIVVSKSTRYNTQARLHKYVRPSTSGSGFVGGHEPFPTWVNSKVRTHKPHFSFGDAKPKTPVGALQQATADAGSYPKFEYNTCWKFYPSSSGNCALECAAVYSLMVGLPLSNDCSQFLDICLVNGKLRYLVEDDTGSTLGTSFDFKSPPGTGTDPNYGTILNHVLSYYNKNWTKRRDLQDVIDSAIDHGLSVTYDNPSSVDVFTLRIFDTGGLASSKVYLHCELLIPDWYLFEPNKQNFMPVNWCAQDALKEYPMYTNSVVWRRWFSGMSDPYCSIEEILYFWRTFCANRPIVVLYRQDGKYTVAYAHGVYSGKQTPKDTIYLLNTDNKHWSRMDAKSVEGLYGPVEVAIDGYVPDDKYKTLIKEIKTSSRFKEPWLTTNMHAALHDIIDTTATIFDGEYAPSMVFLDPPRVHGNVYTLFSGKGGAVIQSLPKRGTCKVLHGENSWIVPLPKFPHRSAGCTIKQGKDTFHYRLSRSYNVGSDVYLSYYTCMHAQPDISIVGCHGNMMGASRGALSHEQNAILERAILTQKDRVKGLAEGNMETVLDCKNFLSAVCTDKNLVNGMEVADIMRQSARQVAKYFDNSIKSKRPRDTYKRRMAKMTMHIEPKNQLYERLTYLRSPYLTKYENLRWKVWWRTKAWEIVRGVIFRLCLSGVFAYIGVDFCFEMSHFLPWWVNAPIGYTVGKLLKYYGYCPVEYCWGKVSDYVSSFDLVFDSYYDCEWFKSTYQELEAVRRENGCGMCKGKQSRCSWCDFSHDYTVGRVYQDVELARTLTKEGKQFPMVLPKRVVAEDCSLDKMTNYSSIKTDGRSLVDIVEEVDKRPVVIPRVYSNTLLKSLDSKYQFNSVVTSLGHLLLGMIKRQGTYPVSMDKTFVKKLDYRLHSPEILERLSFTMDLSTEEEYLSHYVQNCKRKLYKRSLDMFHKMPKIKPHYDVFCKSNENGPNDPDVRKSRIICNPSLRIVGPGCFANHTFMRLFKSYWTTLFQENKIFRNWPAERKFINSFVHGKNTSEISTEISKALRTFKNPAFISLDIQNYDASQEKASFEMIDHVALPYMRGALARF
jgi:hypothetical protein